MGLYLGELAIEFYVINLNRLSYFLDLKNSEIPLEKLSFLNCCSINLRSISSIYKRFEQIHCDTAPLMSVCSCFVKQYNSDKMTKISLSHKRGARINAGYKATSFPGSLPFPLSPSRGGKRRDPENEVGFLMRRFHKTEF